MATFSIVGSSTITITSAAVLDKGHIFGIVGASTVTVTSTSTLLKRHLFNIIGAGLITIDSVATLLKRRLFTAFTGTTTITVSSSTLTRKVSQLPQKIIASRLFTCKITGAADSLSDLEVPISNINIDHNATTGLSSIAVTVPNGPIYSDNIIARLNGGILITATDVYIDGNSDSIDFVEYPIGSIQSNEGARNFSVSLQGSVVNPIRTSVNAVNIFGVSFRPVNADGSSRIRSLMNKDVLPGDIITTPDNDTFSAGNIAMVIRTSNMFMEITKDA